MITKMQDDIRYPYLYQMVESPKSTSERFGSILWRFIPLVDKDDREGGGREMGEFLFILIKGLRIEDVIFCKDCKTPNRQ